MFLLESVWFSSVDWINSLFVHLIVRASLSLIKIHQ